MGFEQNFKVLADIPEIVDGRDHEIPGIEILTNRPVVVHFLAENAGPEQNALLRRLLSLGPGRGQYVLEAGTWRARSYIVTLQLPGNAPLREWIADTGPAPYERAGPELGPAADLYPPAGGPEVGEFTKRFLSPGRPPAPSMEFEPFRNEGTPPVENPPPASAGPGEFTLMFQAPPSAPAGQAQSGGGDELTRHPIPPVISSGGTAEMIGSTRDFAKPMPAPQSDPGEFTRQFGLSRAPATPAAASEGTSVFRLSNFSAPPAARNVVPDSAPAAGEFTRQFGPPPQAVGTGDRTALFSAADFAAAATPIRVEPPQTPVPGEFTREFGSPVAGESPAPAASFRVEPATASVVGDLIRQFGSPVPPGETETGTALFSSPDVSLPAAQQPAGPGAFTRMLRTPSGPPPAPFPSAAGTKTGATGAFEKPETPVLPPAPRAPGKYTREFESPVPPPGQPPRPPAAGADAPAPVVEKPPAAPAASATAAVPPETSYTTLVLGLVVFLLAALLLVVIFALRK